MKKMFKFTCDCGRAGSLEGTFVLDDEQQAKLEALYGKRLYFGEALGKHSDVMVDLERTEIEVVTDDQEFLGMAEKLHISLDSGYNPLDYAEDAEEP